MFIAGFICIRWLWSTAASSKCDACSKLEFLIGTCKTYNVSWCSTFSQNGFFRPGPRDAYLSSLASITSQQTRWHERKIVFKPLRATFMPEDIRSCNNIERDSRSYLFQLLQILVQETRVVPFPKKQSSFTRENSPLLLSLAGLDGVGAGLYYQYQRLGHYISNLISALPF
ncbi:hypothetical protein ACET3Z_031526 [Daucus carota]